MRRPRPRLQLPAPGHRRGLRMRRRPAEDRARLRRRLGQGHEPRPLRPHLTDTAGYITTKSGRQQSPPQTHSSDPPTHHSPRTARAEDIEMTEVGSFGENLFVEDRWEPVSYTHLRAHETD